MNIFTSKQGVSFTADAVTEMRNSAEIMKQKQNSILCWVGIFDKNGVPKISLGGDFAPQPNAIKDQIADIEFYWYAEPDCLEAIKKHCVWDITTRK